MPFLRAHRTMATVIAFVLAYVMGISEAFATSVNSNLGYGIAFVILIGILLIRPSGLLGKFVPEKV